MQEATVNRPSGNQTPKQEKIKPIFSAQDPKPTTNGKSEALDALVTRVNPGEFAWKKSYQLQPTTITQEVKKQEPIQEQNKIPSSQSISTEYQIQEKPKTPLESRNIKASKLVFSSQKKEFQDSNESTTLLAPTDIASATTTAYYMSNFQKYLKNPNPKDYFNQIYREHFNQSYQALQFVKRTKPVPARTLQAKRVFLSRRPGYQGNSIKHSS